MQSVRSVIKVMEMDALEYKRCRAVESNRFISTRAKGRKTGQILLDLAFPEIDFRVKTYLFYYFFLSNKIKSFRVLKCSLFFRRSVWYSMGCMS